MSKKKSHKAKSVENNHVGGISIQFSKCIRHHKTGKRERYKETEEIKFANGEDLADYFEKHCHESHLKDLNPEQYGNSRRKKK